MLLLSQLLFFVLKSSVQTPKKIKKWFLSVVFILSVFSPLDQTTLDVLFIFVLKWEREKAPDFERRPKLSVHYHFSSTVQFTYSRYKTKYQADRYYLPELTKICGKMSSNDKQQQHDSSTTTNSSESLLCMMRPAEVPRHQMDDFAKWVFSFNNALQQGSVGTILGWGTAFTLFRNSPTASVALAAVGCGVGVGRAYVDFRYVFGHDVRADRHWVVTSAHSHK